MSGWHDNLVYHPKRIFESKTVDTKRVVHEGKPVESENWDQDRQNVDPSLKKIYFNYL